MGAPTTHVAGCALTKNHATACQECDQIRSHPSRRKSNASRTVRGLIEELNYAINREAVYIGAERIEGAICSCSGMTGRVYVSDDGMPWINGQFERVETFRRRSLTWYVAQRAEPSGRTACYVVARLRVQESPFTEIPSIIAGCAAIGRGRQRLGQRSRWPSIRKAEESPLGASWKPFAHVNGTLSVWKIGSTALEMFPMPTNEVKKRITK